MSLRPIVIYDDPRLRKKSHKVRQPGPDLEKLVDDMVETMHTSNGVGLAAIQVGVPQRVIVVQVPEYKEDEDEDEEGESREVDAGRLYVLLNPKLARRSRDMEEGIEGCLSVPGLIGEVPRHYAVTVKGLDRRGKPVRLKAEGFLARVFQHEIDHCDGILFIDHIDDPEKLHPVEVGQEEAAEAAQEIPTEEQSRESAL